MELELEINGRTSKLELIDNEKGKTRVKVDGKIYEVDLEMVENGVYSIIYKNKSYNVELIQKDEKNKFNVNTLYNSFDVEVIDAESRYRRSRKKDDMEEDTVISSPMPGKVVRINVSEGEKISAGTTVIVVSAMKMESEYKVKKDRIVKEILVKAGDTIDGNQKLVVVE